MNKRFLLGAIALVGAVFFAADISAMDDKVLQNNNVQNLNQLPNINVAPNNNVNNNNVNLNDNKIENKIEDKVVENNLKNNQNINDNNLNNNVNQNIKNPNENKDKILVDNAQDLNLISKKEKEVIELKNSKKKNNDDGNDDSEEISENDEDDNGLGKDNLGNNKEEDKNFLVSEAQIKKIEKGYDVTNFFRGLFGNDKTLLAKLVADENFAGVDENVKVLGGLKKPTGAQALANVDSDTVQKILKKFYFRKFGRDEIVPVVGTVVSAAVLMAVFGVLAIQLFVNSKLTSKGINKLALKGFLTKIGFVAGENNTIVMVDANTITNPFYKLVRKIIDIALKGEDKMYNCAGNIFKSSRYQDVLIIGETVVGGGALIVFGVSAISMLIQLLKFAWNRHGAKSYTAFKLDTPKPLKKEVTKKKEANEIEKIEIEIEKKK